MSMSESSVLMRRSLHLALVLAYVVCAASLSASAFGGVVGIPLLVVTSLGSAIAHPAALNGVDRFAVAVAKGANLFTLSLSLWLFRVPAGTSIRPTTWIAFVLIIGVLAIVMVASL